MNPQWLALFYIYIFLFYFIYLFFIYFILFIYSFYRQTNLFGAFTAKDSWHGVIFPAYQLL